MKFAKYLLILIFLLGIISAQHPSKIWHLDPYNPEYAPKTILVKFKDKSNLDKSLAKTSAKTGISAIDKLNQKYEVISMEKVFKDAQPALQKKTFQDYSGNTHQVPNLDKIYKMKYESNADPKEIIKDYQEKESVEYAEPDYYVYSMATEPDDPFYQSGDQWYLDAVNAPAAWDSTTGDTSQIISIIDTGTDWDHPDLDDNIWINSTEYNGIDGVDDDGNGFIDDVRGWDFINDDNDPNDDNSHGTHVAGIAGAETDNGIGIAGICWQTKLMPVKMLQSSGAGSSSDLAASINYAANNGATVINMSLGSYGESMTVKTALENAYAYSVLVAAAGNNGYKVDPPYPPSPLYAPMYPACYGFVIGVEATTQSGILAGFSNIDPSGPIVAANSYGHNYEIKAPGVGIYSTFPNGNYNNLSGTSMASPIVAGAVSLMKSYKPTQSTEQLFARLIQGANNGILDIFNSLDYELEPDLRYVEYTLVDTLPGCDNDGIADAGETVEIYLTVKNAGGFADSVWSKLRFAQYEDTTTANITDSTSYIGDISAYATMTGELDPFMIDIDPNVANNRDICFEYEIGAANQSSFTGELIITVQNGIELSGIYTGTTILYPDNYYIVTESVVFDSLIIKPGVQIKFNEGKDIGISQKLLCNGTKDSLITFTKNTDNYWGTINDYSNEYSIMDYCIVEYARSSIQEREIINGIDEIRNSIFRFNKGPILFSGSMKSFSNNFLYNHQDIGYTYPFHSTLKVYDNFEYNVCYKNQGLYYGSPAITVETQYVNLIKNNCFLSNEIYDLGIFGNFEIVELPANYFGTTDSIYIANVTRDYFEDSSVPALVIENNIVPSDSVHGIVWKVKINDVLINKYDNPYNSPTGLGIVGAETLKFDVHFNRAMDTTYTPFLTFGVREPYTQNIVTDSSFWSADSTVWTAYKTIGLETGDGVQRVRVYGAKDDEHFEIPIENGRFEFVIQAAGAASIEFVATPGIGKVDLEWPSASTEDALGYNLYRSIATTDSTWSDSTMINDQLITDTTFTDFKVIPDTAYKYLYTVVGTDMQETDPSKKITARPFSAANGDANGDMSVDVLDIISVVSYMLQEDPQPFLFDAADLNGDDMINILDIISIVNEIQNSTGKIVASHNTKSMFTIDNDQINLSSDGAIAGYEFKLIGNINNLSLSSEVPFELGSRKISEDTLQVVAYSLKGNILPAGNHTILKLNNPANLRMTDLIVSSPTGQQVQSRVGQPGQKLVPEKFALHQNYPNPFNARTTIKYNLPEVSDVKINIYNLLGQKVFSKSFNNKEPGYYQFYWNGKNQEGSQLSSGLYLYRIRAGSFIETKKMILLK